MKKAEKFRSVLIFGGAGFIGSNLAHRLLASSSAKVHVFDNLSRYGVRHNLEMLQKAAGSSSRLQITVGDIRDQAMVERAVRPATEIYHFAAQVAVTTSVSDPRLDFETNLQGTFNILEAVRKHRRHPFLLFTSTNKVYGRLHEHALVSSATRHGFRDLKAISEAQPLDFYSPYGCSKGAADQYVCDHARIYGIPAVVFRMSCIAGPRQFGNEDQGWMAHFLYSALHNLPVVIYGDGRQVRDVLCVHDLVSAMEAVYEQREVTAGQVYNLGGGPDNTVSLLELIAMIEAFTGCKLKTRMQEPRPGDQAVYVTDFSKLQRDTGWQPKYNVSQTMQAIFEWWKRNRELFEVKPAPQPISGGVLQQLPGAA